MTSTADLLENSVENITGTERKTFKQMNSKEKLRYIKEVITVEPLVICYALASVLCGPALIQLELEKACKANSGFNDTICDAITQGADKFEEEKKIVQGVIADMKSWKGPVENIAPLILVLFLGSYSDRHKLRKPFMLFPILGEFFAVAGCILCVIFMSQWPVEAQGVAQTVIPSFFGGPTMVYMAVFSYIADISTIEMRTLRIGVVQFVLLISAPIFQLFSGLLFSKVGYIAVLCIANLFYVIALLYGVFAIKESRESVQVDKKNLFIDMFSPKYAIETCNVLIKKKPGNKRMFIGFSLLILFICQGITVGESNLIFLYANLTFKWTSTTLQYFFAANTVIHLVSTAVGLPLFTKIFKLNDYVIMLIAFMDKVLCNLIIVATNTQIGFYVGIAVSAISDFGVIAIRSEITKVVASDDLGKAQSLFGITEALAAFVAAPVYSQFYEYTLQTSPISFFTIGIVLLMIASVFVVIMFVGEKRTKAQDKSEEKEAVEYELKEKLPNETQTTHI